MQRRCSAGGSPHQRVTFRLACRTQQRSDSVHCSSKTRMDAMKMTSWNRGVVESVRTDWRLGVRICRRIVALMLDPRLVPGSRRDVEALDPHLGPSTGLDAPPSPFFILDRSAWSSPGLGATLRNKFMLSRCVDISCIIPQRQLLSFHGGLPRALDCHVQGEMSNVPCTALIALLAVVAIHSDTSFAAGSRRHPDAQRSHPRPLLCFTESPPLFVCIEL